MFSYQHVFHAGNHADVLKHVVLVQTLLYTCRKETPFFYIDTHAGAGVYSLEGAAARKKAESDNGIGKIGLEKTVPGPIESYLQEVRRINPDGKLRFYPGSPRIADNVLRGGDRLRLYELHPTENHLLEANCRAWTAQNTKDDRSRSGRGKRITVEKKDGFSALKSLLPPPFRRAVVLIDPPYEDKTDYRKVIETVSDALKRFSTGTYLIWYPLLQRPQSRQLAGRLKQVTGQEWLNVTLSVGKPVPDGSGFVSSGMFVINPPWKLDEALREAMPYLVAVLGQNEGAGFTLETGKGSLR